MPRALLLLVVMFVASGCGTREFELSPVSGIVTLDGTPVAGARVIFEPMRTGQQALAAGPSSDGTTDEAGRYSLELTSDGTLGAVVGDHSVTISTYLAEFDRSRNVGQVVRKEEIPPRYFEPDALMFKVPAEGTEQANFPLVTRE